MSEDHQLTLNEISDSNDPPKAAYLENSAFGDIPEDWTWEKSREHLEYIESGISDSQNKDGEGIPVSRIETIADGVVNYQKVGYIHDDNDYSSHRLNPGDLLFSNINSRDEIGKTAIYQGEKPLYHGMNLLRIHYNSSIFNPYFAYYIYDSPMAKDVFFRMSKAAVGQSSINQSQMERLFLPLPPLQEQRKIATVLYNVDQAIQKTEEIIEEYQSIISGLIQDIATTGINNSNLEKEKVPMLPEKWKIPKHWELEFLENISTLITDGAHQTPTYVENGVPFLKVEDIKQEKIDWESVARIPEEEHHDLIKRGNPTKGDVLLSKNGTIGISKVVDWNREFSHFVSLALIRPNQNIILPDYLAMLLESQICMRQAKARSKTGTVTNLHLEEIEKLSIPVPPISEQREILEKVSAVEDCLNSEIRYRGRLKRLKKGLMQDLLSGTVRTTDTNIEVPDEIALHG